MLSNPTRRRTIKLVHALLQTLVGVFIVLAIVFAVEYKADQHGAHFWSVHAWIGAGAIALYCLQYPLGSHPAGALLPPELVLHPSLQLNMRACARAGLYVYLLSSTSPERKADFYRYHRYDAVPAPAYVSVTQWLLSVAVSATEG